MFSYLLSRSRNIDTRRALIVQCAIVEEQKRPPEVNDDVGDVYPYVYALTSDGFTYKEMLDYADYFRDEIMTVDGVGKVEFHGHVENVVTN